MNGQEGAGARPRMTASLRPGDSQQRRRAVPGVFFAVRPSETETMLLRKHRKLDGLTAEEVEERVVKLAKLESYSSSSRRNLLVGALLATIGFAIMMYLNPHLGMARSKQLYSLDANTARLANASRCIPETTCPYVTRSTSAIARYLYRDPETRSYDRVVIKMPDPLPANMVQVKLTVYTRPCDQPLDESMTAFATFLILHGGSLPLIALDFRRKYRQFLTYLHEPDISPEPVLVNIAKRVVALSFYGYIASFLFMFNQLRGTKTCQFNVPELYFAVLGFLGFFVIFSTLAFILWLYLSVSTFSFPMAMFWITVNSLMQTLMPLGQFVWHTNHSVCILRDVPFLTYAPLCSIGRWIAIGFTGIGLYSIFAAHFVPPYKRPSSLRLYIKLSILCAIANSILAMPFLAAMSGVYQETYLTNSIRYCPFSGPEPVGCIKSGIMPWAWMSNCWKNTTESPYTQFDQALSCRLCYESASCVDSDPADKYDADARRTTLATLSCVVLVVINLVGIIISRTLALLMEGDGVQPIEIILRRQQYGAWPFWDEIAEGEWQKKFNPTEPEHWRIRIKRTASWKVLGTLFSHREFDDAAAQMFTDYVRFCERNEQVLLEKLNEGDIEGIAARLRTDSASSRTSASSATSAASDGDETDGGDSTDAESDSDESTAERKKEAKREPKQKTPESRPSSARKSTGKKKSKSSGRSPRVSDASMSSAGSDDSLQRELAAFGSNARPSVRTFQ